MWLSNSRKVINSLPASERAAQVKDLDFDKLPIERALGVQWNISSDQFGFRIVIKDRSARRRGILSIVSSVYDPLGFVAPFILNAKLILQDLCRTKLDWDDIIPEEFLRRWRAWLQELPKLEQITIDRCFKAPNFGDVISNHLHHFSDASQKGYGAVTYLRITDNSGNIKCSFVMGKSRLAPMKPVTIPRMELSAAVVATRLDTMSRKELSLPITESFFWTDSTCVLRYIANQDKLFQTFVASRPATIQEVSSPSQWRYVNTQSNLADDASRGVSADSLHRWIHGPEFLTQPTDEWPQRPADMITDIPNNDPEVKTETAACLTKTCTRDPVAKIMEKFSSWSRLKKVVAWILRYKTNLHELKNQRPEEPLKIKSARTISPISVTELKNAEAAILKCIQGKSFKQECDQIKHANRQSSASNHRDLRKSSSIYLQA